MVGVTYWSVIEIQLDERLRQADRQAERESEAQCETLDVLDVRPVGGGVERDPDAGASQIDAKGRSPPRG